MGFVGDFVDSIFDPGDDAARAAEKAAQTQSDWQMRALDYMKQREAIPQQFREGALSRLGGLYGLEGGTGSQEQMIKQATASPLYQSLMGGREAGEEAILRNAAATGGLRSGNVQSNLYDYNTQLQNQALLQAYNQQVSGLGGLANLPSMTGQIANQMSGIGQTQGQGILGAAQSQAAGDQQAISNIAGLGKMGFAALGLI